jgi:hypothetical protein
LKIRSLGAPAAAADSSAPTKVHVAMEGAADALKPLTRGRIRGRRVRTLDQH